MTEAPRPRKRTPRRTAPQPPVEPRRFMHEVIVMFKPGVPDAEGEAIMGKLHAGGYPEVDRVNSGKFVEIIETAPDHEKAQQSLQGMIDQLLKNNITEYVPYLPVTTRIDQATPAPDPKK